MSSVNSESLNEITLKKKANKINQYGETPLHIAAKSGQVETAKRLLKDGAQVNISDYAGWQPLHEACSHGHTEVASLLITHGAEINNNENKDEHITPLHDAASHGHLQVVKLLIDNGASLNIKSGDGATVLQSLQEYIRVRELSTGNKSMGSLESCKQVEALIVSKMGREITNELVMNGNEQVTARLEENNNVDPGLENKDANKRNKFGETPLHVAAKFGKLKKAKLLLEQGAKVNIKDNDGWQPLHEACIRGHTLVASLLIKHGADINNNENKKHITPLHDAASNGHLHAVKLLVNSGASLQLKSAVGETVLESMQVLIRGEEASTVEPPSGFLDKRKQVEAFISSLIKRQKSKKIKIKTSKENLCKEIISKVNTSKENNHKSEAFILSQLETDDFDVSLIDENEEVATRNKMKTNDESRLEQNDVIAIIDLPSKNIKNPDVSINNVEPRPEQKVSIDHSQSFTNGTSFQYEIDACIEKLVYERSTHNAGETIERSTHNEGKNDFISTHIESNISTTDSKTITARSAILQVKATTNEYSMFSKDIVSNSLIKSDDELVSNKLNHRTISNTDSVLQINIHEHDQFMLVPFHNSNEMSDAGWFIDKNKTCIELVRSKVGSPLSPLRLEHSETIQLNKKFDVFEQKQTCTTNDRSGPSKSNTPQGETSTVPKISPPTKTTKTATPKIQLSTPKVKKTTKSSTYQQPTKRGSVKSVKKKKQIEDQNQRKIDNWFMKTEPKEAKSTTSTDIA